jgi:hypothetical protein
MMQPKEGDAMHVHDEEAIRKPKPVEERSDGHDIAVEAAARAIAAGRLSGHEPRTAVLRLQRLAGNSGVGSLVGRDGDEENSPVLDVVGKGGGAPLPADVRTDMEAHLDADLSDVRVHSGGAAAESAKAVQARAYTVGNDVVFGSGAYEPGTDQGRHTLAHELTHVVQQRSGPVDATPVGGGIAVSHPDDRFEREAEASAEALRHGDRGDAAPAGPTTGASVQRQEVPEEEGAVQAMTLQRQDEPEEEEGAVQAMALQRQNEPEEEEEAVQAMALQRQEMAEEEEESTEV